MRISRLTLLCSLCAVLLVGAASICGAANMLVNGDMETPSTIAIINALSTTQTGTGSSGWGYRVPTPGYCSYGTENNYWVSYRSWSRPGDTTWTRHSGNDAIRWQPYNYQNTNCYIYQDVAVNTGADYDASVWVYLYESVSGSLSNNGGKAELILQELDSNRNVLTTSTPAATIAVESWTKLAKSISVGPNTAYVRVNLHNYCAKIPQANGHIVWDDAMFDRAVTNITVSGVVTSGGSALPGATVEIGEQTVTTLSNGSYTLTAGFPGNTLNIRTSKTGYYAQTITHPLVVGQNITQNFNMALVGSNLLKAAGFDDGLGEWNIWRNPRQTLAWTSVVVEPESAITSIGGTPSVDFGVDAVHIWNYTRGDAKVFQWLSVNPSASYTAKCRFKAGYDPAFVFNPALNPTDKDPINWNLGNPWDLPVSSQWAKLFVEEYSATGKLVALRTVPATVFNAWQTLQTTFTTTAQTRYAKVGGWANIIDFYRKDKGRAIFDSFEFGGPAGPAATLPPTLPALYGTVTDRVSGLPISGAAVTIAPHAAYYLGTVQGGELNGYYGKVFTANSADSTTTDSNGYWSYASLPADTGGETPKQFWYPVRVSAAGYNAQTKPRSVGEMLDFALDPVGQNILADPGFDDGFPAGAWIINTPFPYGPEGELWALAFDMGPWYFDTGEGSVFLTSDDRTITNEVTQVVPVQPDSQYEAKCRFMAGRNKRWEIDGPAFYALYHGSWNLYNRSKWEDGIQDSYQAGYLVVAEIKADGSEVERLPVMATRVDDWETLSTGQFTTAFDTVAIRITGRSTLSENWYYNRAKAVFDSFELNGAAVANQQKISDIANLPVNTTVYLLNKLVAVGPLLNIGPALNVGSYIEEPNRSSGIRTNLGGKAGSLVSLFGVVQEDNGEKFIAVSNSYWGPQGTPSFLNQIPAPLGITKRAMDSGLSAVGLRVTTWGKVLSYNPGTDMDPTQVVVITDGSDAGVKVYVTDVDWITTPDYTPTVGDYVTVTGALGQELQGENLIRVIRATGISKMN